VVPEQRGAFTDFVKVARLQRLMRETRVTLWKRFPRLPNHVGIGQQNMPQAAEYAFGGSKALQAWYRDTTLRWVRSEEFHRHPETDVAAIVEYEESSLPQVALVRPDAMRAELRAVDAIQQQGDHAAGLRWIDRADSLQPERDASVFIGSMASIRALCLLTLGDAVGAEREAMKAVMLWPSSLESKMVLASAWGTQGQYDRAEAMLDSLAAHYPEDSSVIDLLGRLRALRAARGRR
jgi:tetratricopeptide (TPR) repeat protein